MKVIDLLNKIAKGENFENCKMKFNVGEPELVNEYVIYDRLYEEDFTLNDKVEIIEEEKEIKELPIIKNDDNTTSLQGKDFNYTMKTVDVILANKINELVREVRKLKNK